MNENMFYVEQYGAYAFIIEGSISFEELDARLSKADGTCETINPSFDVNCEFVADGKVDLKDATAAYACSIGDFNVAEYMELYLRADVKKDFKVDINDVNAIVAYYNN